MSAWIRIAIPSTALLLLSFGFTQSTDYLEDYRFKGKVAKVAIYEAGYGIYEDNLGVLEEPELQEEIIFDTSGKPTEHISYTVNEELLARVVFTYSKTGFLLSMTRYYKDEVIDYRLTLTYNDEEQLSSAHHLAPLDQDEYFDTFHYRDGLLIEKRFHTSPDASPEYHFKEVYHYNKNGYLEGIHAFDSTDSFLGEFVIDVDAAGKKLEERQVMPDGAVVSRTVYKYFPDGSVSEIQEFDEDSKLSSKDIFDTFGSPTEKLRFSLGKEQLDPYRYEYDSYGNWTKKYWGDYVKEDGEVIFKPGFMVQTREFTYY